MPHRICIHWTASPSLTPNWWDKRCYHYISDGDGKIHKGYFRPEANDNTADGVYARHTGWGNTGTIGIAVAGADKGYRNCAVMTRVSFEAMLEQVAKLCIKYGIPVSPGTVYTHYEFEKTLKQRLRTGKVDITSLHWEPDLRPDEVGNYIRGKVNWYVGKLKLGG